MSKPFLYIEDTVDQSDAVLDTLCQYNERLDRANLGQAVTLYAMVGWMASPDPEFLDWLSWTRAFPFVVLRFNGGQVYTLAAPEAYRVWRMETTP